MVLRLVQFKTNEGSRAVAALDADAKGRIVNGVATTYDLARGAIAQGISLEAKLADLGLGDHVDIRAALSEGRVLAKGTPKDIVDNADVRRVYLGEHFRM